MNRRNTWTPVLLVAMILAVATGTFADLMLTSLQPATAGAWEKYYLWADHRVDRQLADGRRFLIQEFLPQDERSAVERELKSGRTFVREVPREAVVPPGERFEVPRGEIHHLWGAVMIPAIRLPELLAFLQDYGHHAGKFADIEQSELLSRDGDRFRFFFRLRRTQSIVTAYYNSEQECVYRLHSPTRVSGRSVATRIAEIANPGTPQEAERPVGNDRGFLWRLVSWWRFEETPAGVIVEVESASLSRDIPALVNWLPPVRSYIRATPRESLDSVLTSIRAHFR